MDIKIKTNINRVVKKLNVIERQQIPFAASVAINETLGMGRTKGKGLDGVLRREMIKRLDRPMTRTTKAFFRKAANKKKLDGTLGFFDWASDFMKFLVFGGTRATGKNIPIPYKQNARLNQFGNIVGKKSGLIKKKSQFFGNFGGVDGVYERAKKESKPRLIIGFKKSVNYKPIFPFYEIAGRYINFTLPKKFDAALKKAIKSVR